MQVHTERYLAEVTQSDGFDLVTRAQVIRNGLVIADLPVTGGSTNESISDDIRSSMSIEVVDEDQTLRPITNQDPLMPTGVHVKVRSGPRFKDGTTELKPKGEFRLISTRINDESISLEGKDLGYQLSTPLLQPYVIDGGLNLMSVMRGLVSAKDQTIKVRTTVVDDVSNPGIIDLSMSPLSELIKLAAAAGCTAAFDLTGTLIIEPYEATMGTPVIDFIEGENAFFWNPERELNTDGMPSAVIVTANHSTLGAPLNVIVKDNNPKSPTYFGGGYGSIVGTISSDKINSTDQARKLGYRYLRNHGWIERFSFSCSPISALTLGDTITITRGRLGLFFKKAVIEQITYPGGPGEMQITATSRRTLDPALLLVEGM